MAKHLQQMKNLDAFLQTKDAAATYAWKCAALEILKIVKQLGKVDRESLAGDHFSSCVLKALKRYRLVHVWVALGYVELTCKGRKTCTKIGVE